MPECVYVEIKLIAHENTMDICENEVVPFTILIETPIFEVASTLEISLTKQNEKGKNGKS